MVLMLRDGDEPEFFVLSRTGGTEMSLYSIRVWRADEVIDIRSDDGADVPDKMVRALTHGVPIPQHGSLFGWSHEDSVIAVITVYTKFTPAHPYPYWSVLPRADSPQSQWPPFIDERLFGHWFWVDYRAGRIISLGDLVARNPNTVFWVNTKATLGWDCCAIAHDITSPEGHTLRRGRYLYYQVLRAGRSAPSLSVLLADSGKVDLASRFRNSLATVV